MDAVGNRSQVDDNTGVMDYDYDANGNQTLRQAQGEPADTFTYDHENRLVEATIGGVTSTYDYNGDGLRVSRTVDGATTDYIWDAGSALPVILQETAGGQTTYYVHGLDLIAEIDWADNEEYFLYDGLGSTRQLADNSGDVVAPYDHDAFGGLRTKTGAADTRSRFTGEQWDSESGFYYVRARYYDPAIGRFVSQDPWPGLVAVPQSLNRYAYVLNNPALYVDPYGYFGLGDVWDKTKDVAGAAAEFVTNPGNIVSGVQMVSGVVMVASCSSGAAAVCAVSVVVYTGASVTKILMADNVPEQVIVGGTSVLGYSGIPAARITGVVIAGLSDLAEALTTSPGVAYAPGYTSSGGSGVSRPVPPIGDKKE